ncbi:transcription factor EMB1444 isoform X3 [Spinacia oleracea]|uniref:Transcription factor EMB1444 isoform X3 n=1 Tax=Spinacia oleracea TaxID=3562 RepID=A0ABM3QLF1_SPIOL|nr:transcription factor EMB1444-like isoform X3 [Spinacia oleracea]
METVALRQFLNNLCTGNSQWSYAIFWKLQQLENYKFLICEDVYYDFEKSQHQCQGILRDPLLYSRQEVVPSLEFGTNICDEVHPLDYPIGFAVADMSCCQYLLGEGVVGRAALAENDFWIYSDDDEYVKFLSQLEGTADGWLLPMAAGIKVAESLAVAADIRDRFFALASTNSIPFPSYDDGSFLCSLVLMPEPDNNAESPFPCNNLQRMDEDTANTIHDVEFIESHLPTAYDQLVPYMEQNYLELEDLSFFIDDDQNIFTDNNVELNTTSELVISDIPEATSMWMFSFPEEEFDDTRLSGDSSAEICSDSDATRFRVNHTDSRNLNDFPRDCELQVLLRPVFKINKDCDSCKENVSSEEGFGSSAMESSEPFEEGGEQEQLLEDVITTQYKNSYEDTLFCFCNTSKSSVTSLPETALCNTMSDYESTFGMTSAPSLESLESATIVDEKRQQPASEFLDKNSKKPKRSRPRPRDRQLIQDRLKVLRKLVPDSEKCSIDGLLDQTAKHMMFLKSVNEQAEKVKKLVSEEKAATVQGGNDFEACPIIVKDLEHPSQFLIQMVCTDDGVFFEMAEVMHKLKLTILKGTMENRGNKWASFIVEGSKGFNRLDIFWPLMRILQKNGNWIADQLCP